LQDESLSRSTARALGRIGAPAKDAIPVLIQRLDEKNFRSAALVGLSSFGPLAAEALPQLKSLAATSDWDTRYEIQQTIESIEKADRAKRD
jgi:HEAT repeat protein